MSESSHTRDLTGPAPAAGTRAETGAAPRPGIAAVVAAGAPEVAGGVRASAAAKAGGKADAGAMTDPAAKAMAAPVAGPGPDAEAAPGIEAATVTGALAVAGAVTAADAMPAEGQPDAGAAMGIANAAAAEASALAVVATATECQPDAGAVTGIANATAAEAGPAVGATVGIAIATAANPTPDGAAVVRDLLAWYDAHARDLPWRIPPGSAARPDPYRVWLSEIMLQQTTVAAVRGYFARFTARWPDIAALAGAGEAEVMAEWAGLGYYARARNLMACARQVAAAGGFPDTREALQALPGVGDYTSAAIAAIAFDRAETVVDGNVERVTARLFAVTEPLPGARRRLRDLAARLTPDRRAGDFAQAMMDLGATICTPRNPSCLLCPLRAHCAAHAEGLAADLPRRQKRSPRPHREGIAWVLRNPAGDVLVERRPESGLLGGMLAFPSTGWDGSEAAPPADLPWQEAGSIGHVFTHFSARLTVLTAHATVTPQRGDWIRAAEFSPGALPGLFRKVWTVATA